MCTAPPVTMPVDQKQGFSRDRGRPSVGGLGPLCLAPPLDVLPVRTLVGLNVLEAPLPITDGVELGPGDAAMGRTATLTGHLYLLFDSFVIACAGDPPPDRLRPPRERPRARRGR